MMGRMTAAAEPTVWVSRRDVVVMDDAPKAIWKREGGRLVKRLVPCDRAKLQRIADRMNAVTDRTGDEWPIVVGHTDGESPEWEQPPIVGYASRLYVADRGGRPVLLAREWKLYPESAVGGETLSADEVMRRFPRRSPEWHTGDDILDPISILGATSPMQHLGLVRCSRTGATTLDPLTLLKEIGDLIQQALAGAAGGGETAPAVPMDAGGGAAAAAPSSTNAYAPGDDDKLRMQRESFAIEKRQYEDRLKALEAESKATVLKLQRRSREADLIQLQAEGKAFDRDEILADVAELPEEHYQRELVKMRKYYPGQATGEFVRTAGVAEGGKRPAGLTADQSRQARDAALRNGTTYDAERDKLLAGV